MKEKPILFSGPMVRAILEDRKSMTRRIAKVTAEGCRPGMITPLNCYTPRNPKEHAAYCPYGQPGDRLWVKETWQLCDEGYTYRADSKDCQHCGKLIKKWKPSIFMPRHASRITLEITGVRVERMQDIPWGEVQQEGVDFLGKIPHPAMVPK